MEIDKKFINNATRKDYRIVNSIKEIAHELGLSVVSEEIEKKEQFETLKDIGCDYFQGYYFSKPIKFEELPKLMNKQINKLNDKNN